MHIIMVTELPSEIKCKIFADVTDISDIKQLSKTNTELHTLIKNSVTEINGSSHLRTAAHDPPASTIAELVNLEKIHVPAFVDSFYSLFILGQMSKLNKACFLIGEIDFTSAIVAFLDTYTRPKSGGRRKKSAGQFLFYDASNSGPLVNLDSDRLIISDLNANYEAIDPDYAQMKVNALNNVVDTISYSVGSEVHTIILDLDFYRLTFRTITALNDLFVYTNRHHQLVLGLVPNSSMHLLFNMSSFLIIYSIDAKPINLSEYMFAGETFPNVEVLLGLINLDNFLFIQDAFPNLKVLHAYIGTMSSFQVLTYLSQLNSNITTLNLLTTDPDFKLPAIADRKVLITLNSTAYVLNYSTMHKYYGIQIGTDGKYEY